MNKFTIWREGALIFIALCSFIQALRDNYDSAIYLILLAISLMIARKI